MWNMLFVYNKLQLLVLAFTNLAAFRTVYLATQTNILIHFLKFKHLYGSKSKCCFVQFIVIAFTNKKDRLYFVAFQSFIR